MKLLNLAVALNANFGAPQITLYYNNFQTVKLKIYPT